MPDCTFVASWREAMTRSSALTFLKRARRSPALAAACSSMSTTMSPFERSCEATVCLSAASISPLVGEPERSRALNAYVAMALRHPHGAHQAPQLLGGARAGLGQLAGDLVLAHELRERGVHRLHAVLAARLERRVDLVRLTLADQVADPGGRHEHLGRDHAPLAVGLGEQLLGHDPLERDGELHSHLLLLVGREHVHDAV